MHEEGEKEREPAKQKYKYLFEWKQEQEQWRFIILFDILLLCSLSIDFAKLRERWISQLIVFFLFVNNVIKYLIIFSILSKSEFIIIIFACVIPMKMLYLHCGFDF